MKKHSFRVGDKVTLAFNVGSSLVIVPQLVPGRVYCVCAVSIYKGKLFGSTQPVTLIGARRDRRCKAIRDDAIPAAYFRLVSGASPRQQQKGGA